MAFGTLFTAAGLPLASHAFGLHLSAAEIGCGLVIGTVAGMLPDIDHPDSLITHGVIPGSGSFVPFGKGLGWFLSIPPRIIGVPARATMNHRGGTHSVVFMAGWSLLAAPIYAIFFSIAAFVLSAVLMPLLALIGIGGNSTGGALSTASHLATSTVLGHIPLIALSVACGYLSHLFADSLNNRPVPWPWPLKLIHGGRWFFLPPGLRITTGKMFEVDLLRPVVIVLAAAATFVFVLSPIGHSFLRQSSQNTTKPTSAIIDRQKARQERISPNKANISHLKRTPSHAHGK